MLHTFCQYFILFSLMSLALAIFFVLYFLAIMEFEVHGGQITKIYYDLRYLMH